VSEYRPDWSEAPEGARFWAKDSDGQAWWYERRPDAGGRGFGNGGTRERDTNACPDWRETLQERPQAPDRNDWSGAPDWAKARAWNSSGIEHWLESDATRPYFYGWNTDFKKARPVSDYRWPVEDWKDSLLLRPTDEPDEIRTIREELAALTERLAQLEVGA